MPEEKQIFPETALAKDEKPRSLKEKFLDVYYNSIPFFDINLAWFVMSLPVLTIFPALGGLYYAVLELNQEHGAKWGTVWEGFKKHWWLSVRWGLLVLLVNIVLAANIWFYLNLTQSWTLYTLTASIVLLVVWITINQFSFPLLLLQEEKKILLAIRNGYVIVMRQPLAALKVMALNLLIVVVSILLPPLWIFISMALIVNIRTRTVLQAVKKIRQKDAEREAARAHRGGRGLEEKEEDKEDVGGETTG